MCHRWLLGFVVNSVGSSLVFFSYVGWICGLVIWCHFGEIRKDVQKTHRIWPIGHGACGACPWRWWQRWGTVNGKPSWIACWLILAGRFSCMPSFGTFSLWGSQVGISGNHTLRGCYSTHHIGCRLQHKQLLRAVLFCLLERSCYSMCMPRYVSSTFAVSSSRLQKCLKIFDDFWNNGTIT